MGRRLSPAVCRCPAYDAIQTKSATSDRRGCKAVAQFMRPRRDPAMGRWISIIQKFIDDPSAGNKRYATLAEQAAERGRQAKAI